MFYICTTIFYFGNLIFMVGDVKQYISIAVLSFSNFSTDLANDYFSDGIAESIMTRLAKANDFRIIVRTSAFAFKAKIEDARDIGQKLGLQYILDGR